MRAEDYALASALFPDALTAKREAAIAWMGPRWVLHPNNRVQKLLEPLPEVFKWQPRVLKGRGKK